MTITSVTSHRSSLLGVGTAAEVSKNAQIGPPLSLASSISTASTAVQSDGRKSKKTSR